LEKLKGFSLTNNNVLLLTEGHFEECPVWRFDDNGDVYYPVTTPDALPENIKDLRTSVKLYSPNGSIFNGYIVGADKIFSIGIFNKGKTFHFNKNVPESLFMMQFKGLVSSLESGISIKESDLFPMKFETQFNWDEYGYNNFEGVFEIN
jgi:hypothetical protein